MVWRVPDSGSAIIRGPGPLPARGVLLTGPEVRTCQIGAEFGFCASRTSAGHGLGSAAVCRLGFTSVVVLGPRAVPLPIVPL